jgi:purine nucleosidase
MIEKRSGADLKLLPMGRSRLFTGFVLLSLLGAAVVFFSAPLPAVAEDAKSGAEAAKENAERAVPLIFDTDIGNDVDDVLALGVIHALMSRGECELLAVTVTKDERLSAPFVDAINTFYGRGDISIGVVKNGRTPEPSKFTGLAEEKDGDRLRYPHKLLDGSTAPDAVAVLRRTLCGARDGSVVMVQVGFSTNLARLLASQPDEACNLSGAKLVKQKVKLLSVMAGSFAEGKRQAEYNVMKDVPAAQALVADWPSPIVFSGLEIGLAVPFPAESIEHDFGYVEHHPLAEAYRLYKPPPHNRPTWDLTSVLYTVRPERGYFDLSPPGRVHVSGTGVTTFEADAAGPHRCLILQPKQRARVQEALVELASQPPCGAGKGK